MIVFWLKKYSVLKYLSEYWQVLFEYLGQPINLISNNNNNNNNNNKNVCRAHSLYKYSNALYIIESKSKVSKSIKRINKIRELLEYKKIFSFDLKMSTEIDSNKQTTTALEQHVKMLSQRVNF